MNPDHLTHLYCSTSFTIIITLNTITRAQLAHRIHIVQDIGKIPEGARVLEIGPGQGDCTLVLAAAVGEASSVIGVDPCAREYDSPTTVAQSQSHLLTTSLGQRITFIRATPLAHLRSQPPSTYTHVVFLHCLWYFDSSRDISALLSALVASPEQSEQGLRPRPKILIAEWALQVSLPEQVPHLLTTLTRNMLESHNSDFEANIRTVVFSDFIKSAIEQLFFSPLASPLQPRYTLLHEETVTPEPDLLDGQWEVSSVLNEEFERDVERIFEGDERAVAAVRAGRDALAYAVRGVGGLEGCRGMEVWSGEFGV